MWAWCNQPPCITMWWWRRKGWNTCGGVFKELKNEATVVMIRTRGLRRHRLQVQSGHSHDHEIGPRDDDNENDQWTWGHRIEDEVWGMIPKSTIAFQRLGASARTQRQSAMAWQLGNTVRHLSTDHTDSIPNIIHDCATLFRKYYSLIKTKTRLLA